MATLSLPDFSGPARHRRFVRLFTDRIAHDALLSAFFPDAQPLPSRREYDWWEKALAGQLYTGRPPGHQCGPWPTADHLAHWCRLLEMTLDEEFAGPQATAAKCHVLNLGTLLAQWQLMQTVGSAGSAQPPRSVLAAA
ncbi:hypothetical protein MUN81_14625 [Hymenobacter sp. 5317J-9]|uniref:hypothetical protein n=1 Tax=Hymenobacter sp. 5317J-9 TaxID=2932250 RepID=UPI001FD6B29A|nr:hypothetical protein [Hymenobacter sp. 5317J-9]UOQ96473.1 hypothetical protein MUN81_14625 [Hymenobacter sp. 5317J-9]